MAPGGVGACRSRCPNVEYWHWHTLHFGAETYWGGVLPHSGRPGRTYREITQIGAELRAAGDLVASLVPDADVTMLYSSPSKWALQSAPHLSNPDGSPDPRAYHGFFDSFYRGAFEAVLQVRVMHVGQLINLAAEHSVDSTRTWWYLRSTSRTTPHWTGWLRMPALAGTSCSARAPGTATTKRALAAM